MLGLLESTPSGGTPLCRHIHEVAKKIRVLEPELRAVHKKASLIIATDGESSDGDIAAAMKLLEGLPVQVVIRLCTDEKRVVDYWNGVDSQLELELDVLDDLSGEAAEINAGSAFQMILCVFDIYIYIIFVQLVSNFDFSYIYLYLYKIYCL